MKFTELYEQLITELTDLDKKFEIQPGKWNDFINYKKFSSGSKQGMENRRTAGGILLVLLNNGILTNSEKGKLHNGGTVEGKIDSKNMDKLIKLAKDNSNLFTDDFWLKKKGNYIK
jgi:hypothetical protein